MTRIWRREEMLENFMNSKLKCIRPLDAWDHTDISVVFNVLMLISPLCNKAMDNAASANR